MNTPTMQATYVKTLVSKRELHYYKNHPGYVVLDEQAGGGEVGFTYIAKGKPLPDHLSRVTIQEREKMDKQLGTS